MNGLYPPATSRGLDSDRSYDPVPGKASEGTDTSELASGIKSQEWEEGKLEDEEGDMVLELGDGLVLQGQSFGAERSVAGECVFQTGELKIHYEIRSHVAAVFTEGFLISRQKCSC